MSTGDKNLNILCKSLAIMASGVDSKNSKESKTKWLSSDPDELCERLKVLLEEKQTGNNSNIINDELIAIADNLLECNCKPTKQHSNLVELPKVS